MTKDAPAYDYSEFKSDEPVGENLMARIQGLAQEQIAAETRIASLDEQLAEAKAALRNVKEVQLPELLDEAELGDSIITTPAGYKVQLGVAIRGSIPKVMESKAFLWLEEHENGKLIKRTFAIEFGKGDETWANKFERDCAQRKRPLNIKRKKGVHPQTLQSFVRQQLDEGVDFPMDLFGVFRQRFAKVTVKS